MENGSHVADVLFAQWTQWMSTTWNEEVIRYRIHSSMHDRWNTWLHAFSFYLFLLRESYNKVGGFHKGVQAYYTCVIDGYAFHRHDLWDYSLSVEERHSFRSAYNSCEGNPLWSHLKILWSLLTPIYDSLQRMIIYGSCRVRLNRTHASIPYTTIRITRPRAIAERIPIWRMADDCTEYDQNHNCHHLCLQQEEKKRRKCSKWERAMSIITLGYWMDFDTLWLFRSLLLNHSYSIRDDDRMISPYCIHGGLWTYCIKYVPQHQILPLPIESSVFRSRVATSCSSHFSNHVESILWNTTSSLSFMCDGFSSRRHLSNCCG